MRRMFRGRMISVDGCARRMQPNWNCYVINKDNDRGVKLLQIQINHSEGSVPTINPSNTRNACYIKIEPSTTYRISCTKPGYQVFVGEEDSGYICLVKNAWQNDYQVITTTADTAYLSICLAWGDKEQAITVGDCGVVISKY